VLVLDSKVLDTLVLGMVLGMDRSKDYDRSSSLLKRMQLHIKQLKFLMIS
jgi:hypothetical protein